MSEVHRYSVVKMLTEDGDRISYDPHGPEVVVATHYDAALAQRDDLLEALELCTLAMRSCLPDFNPFDQAAYDKALTAIAKARGEHDAD